MNQGFESHGFWYKILNHCWDCYSYILCDEICNYRKITIELGGFTVLIFNYDKDNITSLFPTVKITTEVLTFEKTRKLMMKRTPTSQLYSSLLY
jgi:hypothetical protein